MLDGFTGVIDLLERRRASIERALVALREVDTPSTATQVKPDGVTPAPSGNNRKFSAAARKRMALAQKARWAKTRVETHPPAPPEPEPVKPKRRISPEGIQRIVAATKKRWRQQRAAAKAAQAAKATPPKKAAVKKATPAKPVVKDAGGTASGGATPLQTESVTPAS